MLRVIILLTLMLIILLIMLIILIQFILVIVRVIVIVVVILMITISDPKEPRDTKTGRPEDGVCQVSTEVTFGNRELIRCSESLSSKGYSSPEECFFFQAPAWRPGVLRSSTSSCQQNTHNINKQLCKNIKEINTTTTWRAQEQHHALLLDLEKTELQAPRDAPADRFAQSHHYLSNAWFLQKWSILLQTQLASLDK